MPSSYPGAIDSFVNPLAADPMNGTTVAHAGMHSKVNDALLALQKELGINPRGSASTVAARLATLAPMTHTHTPAQVTGLDAALAARGTGLASSAPAALGKASPGVATTTSRADHVHPLPTLAALGAAAVAHTHVIGDVAGLQAALDAKAPASAAVIPGAGITGGGMLDRPVTVSVNFAGSGTANTASRSDHGHSGVYSPTDHGHDAVYVARAKVGAFPDGQAAPAVVVEPSSAANASAPSTPASSVPVGTLAVVYS